MTQPMTVLEGDRGAVILDWSAARQAHGLPCVDCGRPAFLRDPATDQPRHKPCAESRAESRAQGSTPADPSAVARVREEGAAIGPERAGKRAVTVPQVTQPALDVPRWRARLADLQAVWPPEPIKLHDDEPVEAAAVAPEPVVEVPCRAVQEGDPVPKAVPGVQAALERAGWTVRATYARARLADGKDAPTGGRVVHSVCLRCRREPLPGQAGGRVRAWACWVDGKATGGQISGKRGHLTITAWRAATGSAPTKRVPRKGVTKVHLQDDVPGAPIVDLDLLL